MVPDTNETAIVGVNDLYCMVDSESIDIDDDAVGYTYKWYEGTDTSVDPFQSTSKPFATDNSHLEDVLSYNDTTVGEWTCEVTPFDDDEVDGDLSFDGIDDYIDMSRRLKIQDVVV